MGVLLSVLGEQLREFELFLLFRANIGLRFASEQGRGRWGRICLVILLQESFFEHLRTSVGVEILKYNEALVEGVHSNTESW